MSHAAAFRNLAHLQETASTARMLNLLRVAVVHMASPGYAEAPMFGNPALNRAMLVKHRLRRDELELFLGEPRTATKIIVPIDGSDLRLGGRSLFVGQTNFDLAMRAVFDQHWDNHPGDHEMLQRLDGLPSLDPFLLREHLRRFGKEPARCYFEISDADISRMQGFVETAIAPLADLCFGGGGKASAPQVQRLAAQIMSARADVETEPLRLVLKLDKADYEEGVFCWKAFLYYKWRLAEVAPRVGALTTGFRSVRPKDAMDRESLATLEQVCCSAADGLIKACRTAQRSLQTYDAAFAQLIQGQPLAFRDFLLKAPAMFDALGRQFGGIDHVVSFWRFRFPEGRRPTAAADELNAIFADFEDSLALGQAAPTTIAA